MAPEELIKKAKTLLKETKEFVPKQLETSKLLFYIVSKIQSSLHSQIF